MKDKHCNKSIIDFDMLFDFVEGREEDNYMKIVKDSENYSVGGQGSFSLDEKFSVTFCCSGDETTVAEWVLNIPHSEMMRKIIIT